MRTRFGCRQTSLVIASAVAVLMYGGVARAACSDEIAAMAAKLDAMGHQAGAATSAGQATGAQRSEKAIETRAGGAGDKVMQAKVSLNDANEAMKKGDEASCLAAIAKAKGQIAN